ncbi:MAG: hypothetical protein GY903_01120 [Fuerstiella sp.]|nr:hypothetical protein [Fuerstiella sp.]MCP4853079.1 hypothetical protein [Fuerstiella sp.]
MPHRHTTKIEVAERFERLLKSKLPDFESRIYWVIDDRPPAGAIRDVELVTFCFTGGHFDHPNQVGNVLEYEGTIHVRVWSTNYSDQDGEDRELLVAEPHGLYRVQNKVLLMFDNYLDDGNATDPILIEGMKVLSDAASKETVDDDIGDGFCGVLSVDFAVNFGWDLTADD